MVMLHLKRCVMQYIRRNNNSENLAIGLVSFAEFDASDPRDRVYAVMNMCQKPGGVGLVPDYATPVEDVYVRTARTLIDDRGVLDVLAGAGMGLPRNYLHLPSWAPDWSHVASGRVIWKRFGRRDPYRASASYMSWTRNDGNPNRLLFKGYVVDFVAHILPLPQPVEEDPGKVRLLIGSQARSWTDCLLDLVNHSPYYRNRTAVEMRAIVGRTVSMDQNRDLLDAEHLIEAINLWLEWNDPVDSQWANSLSLESHYQLDRIIYSLVGLGYSTPFGTKESGLLGIGPKGLQQGDRLCIIYGLRFPCLLRPLNCENSGYQAWQFVSVCYVDGIMYGEALEMGQTEEWAQEQVFAIV